MVRAQRKFVPEQRPKAGFRDGRQRHRIGQCDAQSKGGDPPAEHVVVREVIDQRGKAANPLQNVPLKAHGRAKAILASECPREDGARQEAVGDLGGAQPAWQRG